MPEKLYCHKAVKYILLCERNRYGWCNFLYRQCYDCSTGMDVSGRCRIAECLPSCRYLVWSGELRIKKFGGQSVNCIYLPHILRVLMQVAMLRERRRQTPGIVLLKRRIMDQEIRRANSGLHQFTSQSTYFHATCNPA